MKPIEARFSRVHNVIMAAVAAGMVIVALVNLATMPGPVPETGQTDSRFILYAMLGAAMAYYVWLGLARYANREPQVVIDRQGILLGFGRNRRLAWQDIDWVRLRRLGFRPTLQIGLKPDAFINANLGISTWSLDDGLRPVRGTPAAVTVRDNGLDTSAAAMLDAVKSIRPNLIRS
jgi:hypothetical protein